MEYFNAFWVGGLICALTQILMEKTKLMPGRIMVILVCSGALLSALGLFAPLKDYAGSGATVPLLGFGHLLMEGVIQGMNKEGFLGIFKGGFTAGSAGIATALIGSYLASFFFRSKEPRD